MHIERTSDDCYWIGIRDKDGLWLSANVTSAVAGERLDLWLQEAEHIDGVAVDDGVLPP